MLDKLTSTDEIKGERGNVERIKEDNDGLTVTVPMWDTLARCQLGKLTKVFWIDLYVVNAFKEKMTWSMAPVSISHVELFMDVETEHLTWWTSQKFRRLEHW